MSYTLVTSNLQHLVRAYRQLTSFIVRATLLSFGSIALITWIIVMLGGTTPQVVGVALMATSITGGALLLYTFGLTYFPYATTNKTVNSLTKKQKGNIASAATFELLTALGSIPKNASHKELQVMVRRLVASSELEFVVRRLQLKPENIAKGIEEKLLPELTWEKVAHDILKTAKTFEGDRITPEHALGALLLHKKIQEWLRERALTEDDIRFVVWWGTAQRQYRQWRKRWWDAQRILSFTGIGLSWASGYTPFVDQFARLPKPNYWDEVIVGHEGKLEQLINTLARQRQSNVLLVGQPGVGRVGIIRQLYHAVNAGKAHPNLNGLRVLYVHIGELLALGTSSAGQLSTVARALREMERAGNIILVIDGLSSILGEAGEQRTNLTDVLLPFLSSLTVRVVVVTSAEEYHLRIKSNSELVHYFEVVQIPQLSAQATLQRLALVVPRFEQQTHLYIPFKTLQAIVNGTISIMPHVPFPERAFDVLEEAIVAAQKDRVTMLSEDYVNQLISQKVGINVGALKGEEREKLLNLEDIMHQRLINQNTAVKTLAKAMVRARLAIRSVQRPIGTFLFLGPTGVGKTETAKTLAEVYFGSEEHMVRLDMSEFQGENGVTRLIGSGAQTTGRLTAAIADHPFTVLLLDEFEKASPEVHQLFLQVFDEGHLTDARGQLFSFQHAIIIATSNAGAEMIREQAQNGAMPEGFDEQLKEHILSSGIFRPELVNRFDGVIVYTTLTQDHIRSIAKLMLRKLNKRLDAEHGITVVITDELIDFLITVGYNPEFGARPMARAIQDTVEYTIAQKVLRSQVHPGQEIVLTPQELSATAQKVK